MATASVLPDVAARITPQMGGGDATQSMLPNVGDPSIIARQLGGKPLKIKAVRRARIKKQRGGELLTEEQKQFANLFGKKVLSNKREKDENFTDDEINLLRKYILDEEFIKAIYKNMKTAKENEWVTPIYDNIKKSFDSFIKNMKIIFYTDDTFRTLNNDTQIPGKLSTLIKGPNEVEMNNGSRIILLNDFFETGAVTKEALGMLKTIAEKTKTPTQLKSTEFGEYMEKLNNKITELKLTSVAATAAPSAPPSTTPTIETPPNIPIVQTNDICYEKLRKEMKANPDFTSIIENLMSKTPGDLKDLLYSPTHADVRKILREMITLKVEQFKTALSNARGYEETVNPSIVNNPPLVETVVQASAPNINKNTKSDQNINPTATNVKNNVKSDEKNKEKTSDELKEEYNNFYYKWVDFLVPKKPIDPDTGNPITTYFDLDVQLENGKSKGKEFIKEFIREKLLKEFNVNGQHIDNLIDENKTYKTKRVYAYDGNPDVLGKQLKDLYDEIKDELIKEGTSRVPEIPTITTAMTTATAPEIPLATAPEIPTITTATATATTTATATETAAASTATEMVTATPAETPAATTTATATAANPAATPPITPAAPIIAEVTNPPIKFTPMLRRREKLPPIQEANESKNSNNENNSSPSKGGAKTRNRRKGIRVKNTKRRMK